LAAPLPGRLLAGFLSATQAAYLLLLVSFVLNVFVQLFAAECARQLIVRKKILVGQTVTDSVRRFLPALFFGALLPLLLVGGLSAAALTLFNGHPGLNFLLILFMPLTFLIGLAEALFPVVYVLSATPVYKIYYLLGNYLRRNFRHALQVITFILLAALLFNAAAFFLQKLPYAEILVALLGGFQTVFVVYGLVVLFLGRNQVNELV
jgi:hypothetical protein